MERTPDKPADDGLLVVLETLADLIDPPEVSYDGVLALLADDRSRLADVLCRAEQQRARISFALLRGARFKGLDELLRYLDGLAQAFEADAVLARLSFLMVRCTADFETATEASLSGYLSVAADAMRDILEIENILLDFAINPDNIDEWLAADEKVLRTKFSPAAVRKRLHAAGEGRYATTAEGLDYRAHSVALHVSPHVNLLTSKGFSAERGWSGDVGFWEMFMHARRLQRALRRLTDSLSPGSAADQLACQECPNLEDALKRTQEMQASYLAMHQAL